LTDSAVAAFNARHADSAAVHFSAVVRVVRDNSAATGYTFISEPIKSPESINREAELVAKLTNLPQAKLLSKKSA